MVNYCLYFCFVLVCPASLHPAVGEDLFMSDLSPYNSVHGPEQIHIAYGDSPSEMTILWSTSNSSELASSAVLYGLAPKNYSSKAEGKFVLFTEGNPDGLKYIHRVVLQVRFINNILTENNILHSWIIEVVDEVSLYIPVQWVNILYCLELP